MKASTLHNLSNYEEKFRESKDKFDNILIGLEEMQMTDQDFDDLEEEIFSKCRDLAQTLLQEALGKKNKEIEHKNIEGADGIERNYKKTSSRTIKSIFGDISLDRIGYGAPENDSLFPTDLIMNLPKSSFSFSLQKKLCTEVIKGSYDEAIQSISEQTGVTIPKRQALGIIENSAQDFENFYSRRDIKEIREKIDDVPIQVITTDGKGVVMRPDGLRDDTKKRALSGQESGKTRLSKGEKRNRKRMAQVASIYSVGRHIRTPEEIIGKSSKEAHGSAKEKDKRPEPIEKRTWASLEKSTSDTIQELFAEANKRDPECKKETIALVDGQAHQLDCIEKQAKKEGREVTVILDIVHVIEYLWEAANALFGEESTERDSWVQDKLFRILQNKASTVASGIRRTATNKGISGNKRKSIDKTADYLKNLASYMEYNDYLEKGYPIATGVIEGACRHIVKDRMDITGARWGLRGGESVLKLRSIIKSGDFPDYWKFHLKMERERNHKSKYKNPDKLFKRKPKLKLVT